MYSMTGYGKGIAVKDGKTVTVEIKTVNHRYLDYGIKIPRTFMFLEECIKKIVGSRIARGHIDLFLTYEQVCSEEGAFCVDTELANSYLKAVDKLAQSTGLHNDITLSSIVKVPDVVRREQPVEDEELLKALTVDALEQALDNLLSMREKEGESLKSDVSSKLDCIQKNLDGIVKYAPLVVEDYRRQLNARIAEVLEPKLIDAQRLATEVAIFADHCSIDEEIIRLSTHITNMRLLLDADEPVGRKMDFLVQEFNRETNTIGSKANDMRITSYVLAIKNDIEKIREQAANIE